ncbi:MAG: rRNA maturation RNase YbeY [Verrucomicrobiota bacterium]
MSEYEPNPGRTVVNNQCPGLEYDEAQIETLFLTLDRHGSFDAPAGELSFAFLSKKEIARIHREFMDDPTPTDVITFIGDPDLNQAGDICVSPEVALEYATAKQLDFSEELTLYLIHGYLHLAGFDDIDEEDRASMRQAESQAMALAKAHNAMPSFRFAAS